MRKMLVVLYYAMLVISATIVAISTIDGNNIGLVICSFFVLGSIVGNIRYLFFGNTRYG